MVKKLVYCSNCGSKIDDEAYFCPKCGTKTPKGKAAKAAYPSDEIRDAFYHVGIELERAFTIAAKETHSAFKRVSEDLQGKPSATKSQSLVTCPKCGTKNPTGSVFCYNCGSRIIPVEESQGST
jgi:DNA-directed RNA polymerase subunit M/transcription elongation factor TFIIS